MKLPGLLLATLLTSAAFAQDSYTPPRTAWGHPDLQRVWTNEAITRSERPPGLGNKTFLTPEEAAKVEADLAKRRAARDGRGANTGAQDVAPFDFEISKPSAGRKPPTSLGEFAPHQD